MDLGLEILSPARFVSFVFPNPHLLTDAGALYADSLRVAVLDSPLSPSSPPASPRTAAMLVPRGRQDDWIFSTAVGHLQLLLSSSHDLPLSRLILVGDLLSSSSSPRSYSRDQSDPEAEPIRHFQQHLLPLLLALCPRAAFSNGVPDVPFLSFEDDASRILPVETLVGPVAGEMLVEDVELDRSPAAAPEIRRRLRFKRMPNLVQTQVRLLPVGDGVTFRPESGSLVQPYLAPMIAGLSLISPTIARRMQSGSKPQALCVGVGGGALLMCLRSRFHFDVLGIEADEVVLSVARRHFGLVEDEFLKVCVGNGIDLIKFLHEMKNAQITDRRRGELGDDATSLLADYASGFDAVMVDMDSEDAMNGVCAPPLEMVQREVLLAVRSVVRGVAVMNVIPPDRAFYEGLIDALREVFCELYELDVGNGENYVVIATASPVERILSEDSCLHDLKEVAGEAYVNSIKRL